MKASMSCSGDGGHVTNLNIKLKGPYNQNCGDYPVTYVYPDDKLIRIDIGYNLVIRGDLDFVIALVKSILSVNDMATVLQLSQRLGISNEKS